MARHEDENGQYYFDGDDKAMELAKIINNTFDEINNGVKNRKLLNNAIKHFQDGEFRECLEEMRHAAINNHVEDYYLILDKTEIIIKALSKILLKDEEKNRLTFIKDLDKLISKLKKD